MLNLTDIKAGAFEPQAKSSQKTGDTPVSETLASSTQQDDTRAEFAAAFKQESINTADKHSLEGEALAHKPSAQEIEISDMFMQAVSSEQDTAPQDLLSAEGRILGVDTTKTGDAVPANISAPEDIEQIVIAAQNQNETPPLVTEQVAFGAPVMISDARMAPKATADNLAKSYAANTPSLEKISAAVANQTSDIPEQDVTPEGYNDIYIDDIQTGEDIEKLILPRSQIAGTMTSGTNAPLTGIGVALANAPQMMLATDDGKTPNMGLTLSTAPSPLGHSISLTAAGAIHSTASHPAIAAVAQGIISAKETQQGVSIRLDPPEMGRVYIDFAFEDGRVNVVIRAENPETESFLRNRSEEFASLLKEQGLDMVDMRFESDPQGNQSAFQNEDGAAQSYDKAQYANAELSHLTTTHSLNAPSRSHLDGLDLRL